MNRRRPAPKTAARYAALALSAFLLSGPGLAADLIGRGQTTDQVIDGIVGGAAMRETSINIVQHGGSMYFEDNHAIGGDSLAFGGALFATESGLDLWTEGSIIVRSNDVTSDKDARGGAMYANQRMIDGLGLPIDLMAMGLMAGADVVLSGNRAVSSGGYAEGGAVYAQTGAEITAGGKVTLSGNTADGRHSYGGAVYAFKADIAVSGASVLLNDNTAQGINRALGGALYASDGNVKLTGGRIEVVRNKAAATEDNARAEGGALYAASFFDPAASTSGFAPMMLSADTTIDISGNRAEAVNDANGGALYAGDGALITAGREVRLLGNTASGKVAWGGAVYGRYNGITVRGAAVTLSGNIATGIDWAVGGALFSDRSNTTLTADGDMLVSGNVASGDVAQGGAVYSMRGATLTGNTLTVQSNDVTSTVGIAQGGAVYAAGAVKLEGASSVIVRDNKARGATAEGGAIFFSDAWGELAEGAAVTLSADGDVLVSGNSVKSKTDTAGPVYIIAQGGAIWSTVGVSLASARGAVTVENNSAAAAPCDDTIFDETGGGAVWSASDIALSGVSVDVRRNRVQNGNTDVRGGALYSQSGTVALTASGGAVTVQSNDAVHMGSMSASGGVVWAGGSVTIAGSEVAVLGNSATAENARAEGGAVYAEKADIAVRGASVTLSGNTAKGSAVALGGALLASEGNVKLTGGRIEAVRNKAAAGTSWAAGCAVCADNDISISGDTVSVQSNDATSEGGSAYGGALYTVVGSVTIAGDEVEFSANTVSAHKSGFGGAILSEGSVKVNGGSLVFKDNAVSAAYGTGGAIYTAKSVDMQGGAISFAGNSVRAVSASYAAPDGRGGAIKAGTTALLSADAVGLSRNSVTASRDGFGGAIDADSGVTVTGGEISFDRNTVTAVRYANGGAVFTYQNAEFRGDTVRFEGNSVSADFEANGGAVHSRGKSVSLSGSAIALVGNTVTAGTDGYGGAIYASGDVTITGGAAELRENRVTADSDAGGGAVEAGNIITMTVASLLAEGNAAVGANAQGGALYAADGLTVTAAGDIVLRGNSAEGLSGAGGSAIAARGFDNATVGRAVVLTAAGKIEFAGNVAKVNLTAAELEQQVAAAGEQAALMREVLLTQTGGAVFAAGGVTLSADEVIFDGNRVENELGLNRGAVTTQLGSVDITARRVEFRTAGDSVVAGGSAEFYGMAAQIAVPSADIRVTGSMHAAAGTLFAAPVGTLTVRGGDLELYPAPGGTAADAAAVTTFAARAVDLGGARLVLVGSLPVEKGVHRLDFAAVALPQNGAFTPPDISGYREGALLSRDIDLSASGGELAMLADKGFAARMLTLQYTSSSLTWNGGDSGVWAVHGGAKGWTVDETGGRDDFYLGDDVTFGPNAAPETITLSGDIETAQMIVDGDYTFTGGGLFDAEHLHIKGGTVSFARPVTVDGTLTHSGGVLKLDAASTETKAALNGGGAAVLNVTGGTLFVSGVGELANGQSKTFKAAEGFAPSSTWWTAEAVSGDAQGLRVSYAAGPSADKTSFGVTVTALGNIPLTWSGGDGTWAEADGKKLWKRDDGTADDFYGGDSVTFAGSGAISLEGALEAAAMTVNGDYTFAGSGGLNVGELTVAGGSSAFAREVTAKNAALSGAARLTLEGALKVTGAFTQGAGSTLIVDVNKLPMAALLGSGSATLKVESGAALQLKNDTAGASGTSYTIASGFKSVASVWADENVSGEARPAAGGDRVTYAVSSEGGNVSVTVTSVSDPAPTPAPDPAPTPDPKPDPTPPPVPEERSPFRLTAGQSLRSAAGVGAALQGRGCELLNAPANITSYASGFLPLEKGKTGGVWAHTWYSRARVDNATADMTFKNYGVTLGADRQFGTGIAGVAVSLGKSEGRGKGRFDGSDSDGKHIGVGLYGARPIAGGRVTLTGDIGYHWHRDDYDSTAGGDYFRARKAKSRVFTVGGTAWFSTGRPGAPFSLKPFVGVRYSRFSMDDFTAEKNGTPWATIGGERVTQWTVPLGVKFDWTPVNTRRGWKIKPSAELAYVYAGGDRAMTVRQTTLSGGEATRSTQLLSDRDNFRASLGLEAKRKNMTIGLGVDALLSSGQKDVAVNATLRWDL